jgi:hypothetical protein
MAAPCRTHLADYSAKELVSAMNPFQDTVFRSRGAFDDEVNKHVHVPWRRRC